MGFIYQALSMQDRRHRRRQSCQVNYLSLLISLVFSDDVLPSCSSDLSSRVEELMRCAFQSNISNHDNISNVSFSELAKIQLAALQKKQTHRLCKPTADETGAAVLSVAEQSALWSLPASQQLSEEDKKAADKEGYLCMRMTRYLNQVFADDHGDLVLINSEEVKWIVTISEHPDNDMKREFFVVRRRLQTTCPESGSKALRKFRKLSENNDVSYIFGKLSNWKLRDCVRAVIKFKKSLKAEDFGKLVCYLQHLSRHDDESTYYGMVCDDTNVWLVSCTGGTTNVRDDIQWTDAGSTKLIQRFFSKRNQWCCLLDYCCAELGLKLAASDAFLGCGASGRVFRVVTETGMECALKIVFSTKTADITAVEAELRSLQSIKAAGGHTVTAVPNSLVFYRDPTSNAVHGAGYLMTEVGTVMSPDACRSDAQLTTEVLQELFHLHSLRRYHGDPRLPNIIRYGDALLWIDFMRTNLATPRDEDFSEFVRHDTKVLLLSIFGNEYGNNDGGVNDVASAVEAYAAAPSEHSVSKLIEAVLALH